MARLNEMIRSFLPEQCSKNDLLHFRDDRVAVCPISLDCGKIDASVLYALSIFFRSHCDEEAQEEYERQ